MSQQWTWSYKVRYKVLDPHGIYNHVGRKIPKVRHILDRKTGFYNKLEKSVLAEGFRNPIFVVAGWNHGRDSSIHQEWMRKCLPEEMSDDDSKILMCDRNGGSRLFFAKQYNMPIPCIISDYVDRFPECPPIYNAEGIRAYFKDQPKHIKFDIRGVVVLIPHPVI